MYKLYISELKSQVRQSKVVKKQVALRGEKWTISSFELLADMITLSLLENMDKAQQMTVGTTISAKTLANIFKDDYKIGYPLDPRTVNSLSKICIFVGYDSWYDFVNTIDEQSDSSRNEGRSVIDNGNRFISRYILSILDHIRCGDPESQKSALSMQHLDTITCLHPVKDLAVEYSSRGWTINNPFNPTEAELLDFDLLSSDDGVTIFKTRERWLLCWYDPDIKKYVKRWDKTMEMQYQCAISGDGRFLVDKIL
jgi:hypothetical protein